MIQPVTPGPVRKLAERNATNLPPGSGAATMASFAKLKTCAVTCTTVKKTIDQATLCCANRSAAAGSRRAETIGTDLVERDTLCERDLNRVRGVWVSCWSAGGVGDELTTPLSGPRRRMEMKFRQTGRRMNAASR